MDPYTKIATLAHKSTSKCEEKQKKAQTALMSLFFVDPACKMLLHKHVFEIIGLCFHVGVCSAGK